DSFLIDLGLPPYICVEIDDPALTRFELIDRQLRMRREQLIAVRTTVGQLNVALLDRTERSVDPTTGVSTSRLVWDEETEAIVEQLRQALQPISQFSRSLVEDDLPRVRVDLETLETQLPERRRQTDSLLALYREEQNTICSLLGIETVDESIFDLEPVL